MTLVDFSKIPKIKPTEIGTLHCSRWIYLQLLISPEEFQALLQELVPCYVFSQGKVLPKEKLFYSLEALCEEYTAYFEALIQEDLSLLQTQKKKFACSFTKTLEDLSLLHVGEDRYILQLQKPVIQMLPHGFYFHKESQRVQSVSFDDKAIPWGIQLFFPQLYQNTKEGTIHHLSKEGDLNWQVFRNLQKYIRNITSPFHFVFEGKRVHTPFRIGKEIKGKIHIRETVSSNQKTLYYSVNSNFCKS